MGLSRRPVALTIAGSDSSGGAGIVADLKTFEALGVWGTTAVTAVTAQNTLGVHRSFSLPAGLVRAQILAVTADIGVDAAKTGMLATADVVRAVAGAVREGGISRLVVDPVMVAKHGERLLSDEAVDALRRDLLPVAAAVTPNLPEAEVLTGREVTDRQGMVAAAAALAALGPPLVLVTGGHLVSGDEAPDLLWMDGRPQWLEGRRLHVVHTHGTGCVLSAAFTAALARRQSPMEAATAAKQFVTGAIAAGFALGAGMGPVDPGFRTFRNVVF